MRKTRAPIGHMCVERQGRYKMKNSNKLRALEGLKICNEVGSPPPTHIAQSFLQIAQSPELKEEHKISYLSAMNIWFICVTRT